MKPTAWSFQMINYKELFAQPVKDLMYANALQKRWEVSRVQARNRSQGSDVLDYTPPEEIRNQDHDSVRQIDSCPTQTGDTR